MLIVREAAGLAALAEGWKRLARRADIATATYAWARAAAEVFAGGARLHVTVVGDPEEPVAIAPLVRWPRPLRRLELLGVRELSEPTDVLSSDHDALGELLRRLAHGGWSLHFARLPTGSAVAAAARAAYGAARVVERPAPSVPALVLAGLDDPIDVLNAGRRSDLRRARRRAEELGVIETEVVSPTKDELPRLLAEAFSVEAASWKGARGTALVQDALRGAFVRRFAELAVEEGILRLCFLRIGGRAAAMQVGIESPSSFSLVKVGYDADYARVSPGSLLMLATIQYAAARGLASYELWGRSEAWTRAWSTVERPCTCLRAYAPGAIAVGPRAADRGEDAARRLRELVRSRR